MTVRRKALAGSEERLDLGRSLLSHVDLGVIHDPLQVQHLKSMVVSLFSSPSNECFHWDCFIPLGSLTPMMSGERRVVRDDFASSLTTGFQPHRSGKRRIRLQHERSSVRELELYTSNDQQHARVKLKSSLILLNKDSTNLNHYLRVQVRDHLTTASGSSIFISISKFTKGTTGTRPRISRA